MKQLRKQIASIKEKIIQDICQYLTAPKPGGFKLYPALYIAPKGLRLLVKKHSSPQKVIAVLPGYVVTKSKSGRIEWYEMDLLFIETLLQLQKHFDEQIKPVNNGMQLRIYDPFWFLIPDKANENLRKVLDETPDNYLLSFH